MSTLTNTYCTSAMQVQQLVGFLFQLLTRPWGGRV